MEKIDLAFIGILVQGAIATAIVIVIVTNRDSWVPVVRRVFGRYIMSRALADAGAQSAAENAPDRPLGAVKRNGETSGNGVAIDETVGNDPFQFPDVFTGLARLVLDKKIGETDAIAIAIQAKPGKGDKYQEARRRLHAAMEREQPPAVTYRELTPDHRAQLN